MMDPEFFNIMLSKALWDRDKKIREQETDMAQSLNEEQEPEDDYDDEWE